MSKIRTEIKRLDELIAYREDRRREHTCEIERLRTERLSYFRDSGMLPMSLMAEAERQKIFKMKRLEIDCEFCGKDNVRKGHKKSICIDCGHEQGLEL